MNSRVSLGSRSRSRASGPLALPGPVARTLRSLTLLALLLASPAVAAPTVLLTDGDLDVISGFELHDKGLLWWNSYATCSGEFPSDGTARLRTLITGANRTVVDACNALEGETANAARDGSHTWFFAKGKLVRKAINAADADPAQELPGGSPTLAKPWDPVALTVANGRVYWATQSGASGGLQVRSIPADGSAAPVMHADLPAGPAPVRVVATNHYDQKDSVVVSDLLVLTADGVLLLVRVDLDAPPKSPTGVRTDVLDFAVRSEPGLQGPVTTVYAARAVGELSPTSPPGLLESIDLTTLAKKTLYTAQAGTRNRVISVAVDPDVAAPNVYIIEGHYSCSTEGFLTCWIDTVQVKRSALPATPSGWTLLASRPKGWNVRSDGAWLFWAEGTTIMRLPTGAPAAQLDLTADSIEVVQTTQDLANSVRLVAGKRTFVRGYAHATVDTTGMGTWHPEATLTAKRKGKVLLGSPLHPLEPANIDTVADMAVRRPDRRRSFLFELPPLWVEANDIDLELVVDPNGKLPETGGAPNAVGTSVLFQAVPSPCMTFVSLSAHGLALDPAKPSTGVAEVSRRVEAMFPAAKLTVQALPDVSVIDHPDCVTADCCGVLWDATNSCCPRHAYDAIVAIDTMWQQLGNPAGCPITHYVGMVHPAINTKVIAGECNFPLGAAFGGSRAQIIRMSTVCPDYGAMWACPQLGLSVTHEAGHNYGLLHIPCGGAPADKDGNFEPYPYDPCKLGPTGDPQAFYGFDAVTRTVITPTMARDIMTYGAKQWMSDSTLGKLFDALDALGTVSGLLPLVWPAAPAEGPAAWLLVSGAVHSTEGPAMRPYWALPPDVAPSERVAESLDVAARATGKSPYTLRLLGADGATLGETPLQVRELYDDTNSALAVSQYVPFLDGAARVQVLRQGAVVDERLRSAHAPALTLLPPSYDALHDVLTVVWAAGDADPDGVLTFTAQLSGDGGDTWVPLVAETHAFGLVVPARRLPGPEAIVRVLATDGVNTAVAVSAPFALPERGPEVVLGGLTDGQRVPFGSDTEAVIVAFDAEDGGLPAESIHWTLSGSVTRTGVGAAAGLGGLPPGAYTLVATATDEDGHQGNAEIGFEVTPVVVLDGPAPELDGTCGDVAYDGAPVVLGDAVARLAHGGGALYVCIDGLAGGPGAVAGVRIEADGALDPTVDVQDRGYFVGADNVPFQEAAPGGVLLPTLSPAAGSAASIATGPTGWSAELRIDDALLGGLGHVVGLSVVGGAEAWPEGAADDVPATWGTVSLGPLPTANQAPTADAGADRLLMAGSMALAVLDGSASFDPDGDALTFAWTQMQGPSVALTGADTATPSFELGGLGVGDVVSFQLVTSDGALPSLADVITLTVVAPVGLASGCGPGVTSTMAWPDSDGDGYGGDAGVIEACEAPEGWITTGGDCDDGDSAVNPDATEVAGDGIDNDCDGAVDEGPGGADAGSGGGDAAGAGDAGGDAGTAGDAAAPDDGSVAADLGAGDPTADGIAGDGTAGGPTGAAGDEGGCSCRQSRGALPGALEGLALLLCLLALRWAVRRGERRASH
ncbi:MAG: hypothetical protein AMXMBFR64_46490 [Myxococcales bacterium]